MADTTARESVSHVELVNCTQTILQEIADPRMKRNAVPGVWSGKSARKPPMADEALGIHVGDVVRTSYGAGPYEVLSVQPPVRWAEIGWSIAIWPYPVTSLRICELARQPRKETGGINHIHRDGARWITDQGDEVFVEPHAHRYPLQLGLFRPPAPEPYSFQDGVDYSGPCGTVWRCPECGRDYNGRTDAYHRSPEHCTWRPGLVVIVVRPEEHFSVYQKEMGIDRYIAAAMLRNTEGETVNG
jgi:hypothetical protein